MSDGAGTTERAHLLTATRWRAPSYGCAISVAYHSCDMEAAGRKPLEVRRLVAATGLLTIVVTAACGSGSSGSPQGAATDAATAARINLQRTDFPADWQSRTNPVTAPANTRVERSLVACLGTPPPETHTTANVNSPAFVQTSQQASSNVKLSRTAAQSQADYAALAGSAGGDCTRKVLLSTLPGALPFGSTVASSAESSAPATAPPGDQASTTFVTVDLDVQGGRMKFYAEFTTVLRGRALVAVQTVGLGEPFSPSLRQTIVSNIENRATQVAA